MVSRDPNAGTEARVNLVRCIAESKCSMGKQLPGMFGESNSLKELVNPVVRASFAKA